MKAKVFFTLINGHKRIDSYYLTDTRASLKKVKASFAKSINWLPDFADKTGFRLEVREEGTLLASYIFTGKNWRTNK